MAKLIFKDDNSGHWHTNDFSRVSLTMVSWDTRPHTPLAYVFFGHVNMDFDGSPTAYGPEGINPPPDDWIGNAGNPTQGWFGVAHRRKDAPLVKNGTIKIDPNASEFLGEFPVVQQKGHDPKPGYYVSSTPHAAGLDYRQDSYVDSSVVPFGALDGRLEPLGFQMNDYGLAIRHNQNNQSGFYFADAGAAKFALGECSFKVGTNLGVTRKKGVFKVATKHGVVGVEREFWDNNFPVSFIIFPKSATMISGVTGKKPHLKRFGLTRELSEDTIASGIKSRLVELSQAENAGDLPLLMALNEVDSPHMPPGKAKLDEFLKTPRQPKPPNYATVLLGLATFGFWPYPCTPQETRTPFDPVQPKCRTRPMAF
jgi:hypothetical protein